VALFSEAPVSEVPLSARVNQGCTIRWMRMTRDIKIPGRVIVFKICTTGVAELCMPHYLGWDELFNWRFRRLNNFLLSLKPTVTSAIKLLWCEGPKRWLRKITREKSKREIWQTRRNSKKVNQKSDTEERRAVRREKDSKCRPGDEMKSSSEDLDQK
jgi:hypothetical protein